jgi:transposase
MARRKPRVYSQDFKIKVVKEVLLGQLTQAEATRKYGIGGHSCIREWMLTFSGIASPKTHRGELPLSFHSMQIKKTEDELRAQIEQLKAQLEHQTLRADLWQKAVEVAERDLGIPIKKKYGSGPSKPTSTK